MFTFDWLWSLIGIVIGSIMTCVFFIQQNRLDKQIWVELQTKNHHLLEDNHRLSLELQASEKKVVQLDTELQLFKGDWSHTLQQESRSFLTNYMQEMHKEHEAKTEQAMSQKQSAFVQSMRSLLQPLAQTIEGYQQNVKNIEDHHIQSSTTITRELERLNAVNSSLAKALSHDNGRGDWGEIELIRLLEDSGLKEGVGYIRQASSQGQKRPDIRINLPDGRYLFIDARVVQLDIADFAENGTAGQIQERQKRFAKSLDNAITLLSSESYQAQLQNTANFVVLYVPRESILANALTVDSSLFERAYRKNVILAGPFNLMGLLKVVHHSWVMANMSLQASDILKLGTDLHEQAVAFMERFEGLGYDVEKVLKSYQDVWQTFVGQSGFVNKMRKLEDYGCQSGKSIQQNSFAPGSPVNTMPRPMPQPHQSSQNGHPTGNGRPTSTR